MQRITHIPLPDNEEMARAYFPHFVRDLPHYRQNLLRTGDQLRWHSLAQYVSTYYVALECVTTMDALSVLGQELALFVSSIPLSPNDKSVLLTSQPGWIARQQSGAADPDNAFTTLIEIGERLTARPAPQRELIFQFLYVLSVAQSFAVDQPTIDRLRRTLEPISSRLGQRSSAEDFQASW